MNNLHHISLFIVLLVLIVYTGYAQSSSRTVGNKNFELSNHLNNVTEVTTDRKLAIALATSVAYHNTDVISYTDYYPYGMQQDKRSDSKDYRYGFQGQEKDDDVKGEGNSINYKYRMHDPRVGRFFAVDPLSSIYPHYSSYQFSGNKVVAFIELEGLEEDSVNKENKELDEDCKCLKQDEQPTETTINGSEVLRWEFKPKITTETAKISLLNRFKNLFKKEYGGKGSKRLNVEQVIENRWFPTYKPVSIGPRPISRKINKSESLTGTSKTLNYRSPSDAIASVNYTLDYDGLGNIAPNRFIIRDSNGDEINSGGNLQLDQENNRGKLSFSIPANTNFKIEIQGIIDNPEDANDIYKFNLNYTYLQR